MKQKTELQSLQKIPKLPYLIALTFSLIFFFISCDRDQERTTTIYGTITDQNQEPIDSIFVLMYGLVNLTNIELNGVYSDKQGNYELVVDVPKKFHAVDVVIPFLPIRNPKYEKNYTGKKTRINDSSTNNCCVAPFGVKTKYDFQLIPK